MRSSAIAPALRHPVEIIEEVIDHIAFESENDFIPSLHQCSLVSRTWRHRALKHLFEKVYLGGNDSKIYSLVEMLQANPSLMSHIRLAVIHLTPISPAMISLPQLVDVETLAIMIDLKSDCDILLVGCIKWLATTFPHISSLIVWGSLFCSKQDMPMKLFLAFPRLRRLDLDPACDVSRDVPRSEMSGVCTLQAITLDGEHSALLQWLANPSTNMAGTLQDFEWRQWASAMSLEGRESLSAFLNAATSLRKVDLVTGTVDDMALLLEFIIARGVFAANTLLRTLTLTCQNGSPTTSAFLSLVRALRVVRRRSMQLDTVTVTVSYQTDNLADALWTMSDSAGDIADLIVRLGEHTFTIVSLAALEDVFGAPIYHNSACALTGSLIVI